MDENPILHVFLCRAYYFVFWSPTSEMYVGDGNSDVSSNADRKCSKSECGMVNMIIPIVSKKNIAVLNAGVHVFLDVLADTMCTPKLTTAYCSVIILFNNAVVT